MELSTRARRTLSTVLAVFLAIESVSAVAATAATTTVLRAGQAAVSPGTALAAGVSRGRVAAPARVSVAAVKSSAPADAPRVVEPATVVVPAPASAPAPARATVPDKAPKAARPAKAIVKAPVAAKSGKSTTSSKATRSGGSTRSGSRTASYSGTNHVWIPALGISRSVRLFPCDRARPPDNLMYRWGCAGSNNVYLMGHAYSVMKPLHDAYVRGRLRVGMKAYYAGGNGAVHVFKVKWWKVTAPTTAASWAWAAQSVPSMTLQTCVGKNSAYRLMVRLVEIDR